MLWIFLAFSILCRGSSGLNEVNLATECLNGIVAAVTDFTFAGADSDYYATLCTYNLSLYSMWSAAKLYCTTAEIVAGSSEYEGYCLQYGNVELVPYAEVEPKLTDEYIETLQIVDFEDIDATKVWNNSFLISPTLFEISKKTTHVFNEEYATHTRYGWAIYGFWGGLLLIGMVNRLIASIFQVRLKPTTGDIEKTTTSTPIRPPLPGFQTIFISCYHRIRTNLVIPALFGLHHKRLLWGCSIPTRLEGIIVLSYWALNIGFCCSSYEIFWPNLYYTPAIQTWRYVADRAGILCYANLPILWMFSGRNNVFIWATGWSFSTFNLFHRNVARVATLQAVVHAIGWSAIEGNFGYYAESWTEQYWYMGGVAVISMSLLLVSSSNFLRQRRYEVFLALHTFFSVLVIVGLFYHTKIFDGSYNGYLWPLVAIWSTDRILRLVRLSYCNIRVKMSGSILHSTATAMYNEKSDVIRIEVVTPSILLRPQPNQHYFVYQPLGWRGWENHPFTLASWDAVGTSAIQCVDSAIESPTLTPAKLETEFEVFPPISPHSPSDIGSCPTPPVNEGSQNNAGSFKLVFYARPFNGWTKRLRNGCMKHRDKAISVLMMIEGPYGKTEPIHLYENVLFITGGTGISGAISYLHDHIAKAASRSTRTHTISLIFAAKQTAMIREIANHELGPALDRNDISAQFYATSPLESAIPYKGNDTSSPDSNSSELSISCWRPDIKAAILRFVREVSDSGSVNDRLAVLVCGPPGMADEARAAVHQLMKSGKQGVAYFEETFGW